jgi:hypothetical protein
MFVFRCSASRVTLACAFLERISAGVPEEIRAAHAKVVALESTRAATQSLTNATFKATVSGGGSHEQQKAPHSLGDKLFTTGKSSVS